jgi:hypothetical protein
VLIARLIYYSVYTLIKNGHVSYIGNRTASIPSIAPASSHKSRRHMSIFLIIAVILLFIAVFTFTGTD